MLDTHTKIKHRKCYPASHRFYNKLERKLWNGRVTSEWRYTSKRTGFMLDNPPKIIGIGEKN